MFLRGQYSTPVGTLHYRIDEGGLRRLSFKRDEIRSEAEELRERDGGEQGERLYRIEEELLKGLDAYFHRKVWDFRLSLNYEGITPVYRRIYMTLRGVGWGEVVSYSELAEMAGVRRGARAVGGAMSRNPFVIIVPCHRVVGRNSLGGFSAGLERKIWLLRHEGIESLEFFRGTRRI
ncbi:MAG TPA: methylated-DNA--[protein]-cysteine S-methyltransferase [Euryarchaeota archaeon]|nr:methylated-DNA--[protein]-cysteine S-methyltransferase [Euryarchaeota archaeon]